MIIKKAVTFRASSIGDCLMAKYLLENIHIEFPQAKYGIVVAGKAGMIKDLLKAYPWIDVIEASRRSISGVIGLWRKYRGSELVVTQYTGKRGRTFSLSSKIMAWILARKGGFVGFADSFRFNNWLFDVCLPVQSEKSVADHEREVLHAVGVPLQLPFPKMDFIKDDQVLGRFGLVAGKFMIVHLFAGGAGRGISREKKKDILTALLKHSPDINVVVSGGKENVSEIDEVIKDTPVISIAGRTTLQELMNLISQSLVVLSLDTGVAHITAQLAKPLIVLRTCVAPNWWFNEQYGSNAPINVLSCDEICAKGHVYKDYPECIDGISLEEVKKVLKTMI